MANARGCRHGKRDTIIEKKCLNAILKAGMKIQTEVGVVGGLHFPLSAPAHGPGNLRTIVPGLLEQDTWVCMGTE